MTTTFDDLFAFVPAQVWADREIRDALERWDLRSFVGLIRQRSGLHQDEIAELTGLSQGFLSQVESGGRQLTKLDKVIQLFDGLGTPVDLLPLPSRRHQRPMAGGSATPRGLQRSDDEIEARREAGMPGLSDVARQQYESVDRRGFLQGAAATAASAMAPGAGKPWDTARPVGSDLVYLDAAVRRATRLERASQYAAVDIVLPGLLRDVEQAAAETSGERQQDAVALVSQIYALRAWVLIKKDSPADAEAAASRSLSAAQAVDDLTLAAAALRCLAEVRMRAGRHQVASDLAVEAVDLVHRSHPGGDDRLVIRGAAYLSAAMACARAGDDSGARELLDPDDACAVQLRDDRSTPAVFGPSNVDIHRVAIPVDLGDPATALLNVERGRPQLPSGFEERVSRYLIDVARSYSATFRDGDALDALLEAEQTAPEEVRTHLLARSVIHDLLRRERKSRTRGLRALASRCGVLEPA